MNDDNLANVYSLSFEKFNEYEIDIYFGPISFYCDAGSICGSQVNLACGSNQCCNAKGQCGTGLEFCSIVLGCQKEFGQW